MSYLILSEFTDYLFHIIQKKTSLMQDSIVQNAEKAYTGAKDRYICVSSA